MRLSGIGVSPGLAQGRVVVVHHDAVELPATEPVEAEPDEVQRLIVATLEDVARGMEQRAESVAEPDSADVLRATAMIARDPAISDEVGRQLRAGKGRFHALAGAIDHFAQMLNSLGGYMAERVADLHDVHRRAHARLLGRPEPGLPELTEPAVIVATELAPADTVGLNSDMVLAVVTEQGGPTSHTAILASQLGIPAVVQCAGILDVDATFVAVDGTVGQVAVDPNHDDTDEWARKGERRAALEQQTGGPGHTKDGRPVALLANLGTVADAMAAGRSDVEGTGLFRSEFLYLGRQTAPSVEEQTDTYRRIFQALQGRRVVIRTLDSGADKPLPFVPTSIDENPALGMRGMRLYGVMPRIIADQLTAIAQAARMTRTDVWVMAPMVSTPSEAAWFYELAHSVGIPHVGAMIEVPGAALQASHVLDACDFASLGTNDLSQYLFAADRLNGGLADLLDAWQPALWQITKIAADAGAASGKPIGMCGEACGDPLLALLAVGAGVQSLSMALPRVPLVRASLARHTVAECEEMLEAVLAANSPTTARRAVHSLVHPELKQVL